VGIEDWDLATHRVRAVLGRDENDASVVAFSHDGKKLASGDEDGTVLLWDVASGRREAILRGHARGIRSVAFSPDDNTLASGDENGDIILWETRAAKSRGTLRRENKPRRDPGDWILSVAFSPDGKILAAVHYTGIIAVWNAETMELIKTWRGHKDGAGGLAYSPDGRLIASYGWDGKVKIWSTKGWNQRDIISGYTGQPRGGKGRGGDLLGLLGGITFSPDGRTLAWVRSPETVVLWDVSAGRILRVLQANSQVNSIAFRDDQSLALGEYSGAIKMFSRLNP
jgi:WD40 repeat protein